MSSSRRTTHASSAAGSFRGTSSELGEVLLFREDSLSTPRNVIPAITPRGVETVVSTVEVEPDPAAYAPVENKPSTETIHEITGLLKVKTSMLAMGACERVRKLSKAYPQDIGSSPILPELIHILEEGPGTPLAAAALLALSTLALHPEGRQRIVIAGAAPAIVKLVSRCDFSRPNTSRAVQLLMNLAADAQNRRTIREAGGVEAVVAVMKAAPLDACMEQAMGALHNIMLTDSKAKARAVDAGVAYGLARVLALRLDEGAMLSVRCRMLLADLLRIPDMQARIVLAAQEQHLHIPGMMPAVVKQRGTNSGSTASNTSSRAGSHTGEQRGLGSSMGEPGALRPSNLGQRTGSMLTNELSVVSSEGKPAPAPASATA